MKRMTWLDEGEAGRDEMTLEVEVGRGESAASSVVLSESFLLFKSDSFLQSVLSAASLVRSARVHSVWESKNEPGFPPKREGGPGLNNYS